MWIQTGVPPDVILNFPSDLRMEMSLTGRPHIVGAEVIAHLPFEPLTLTLKSRVWVPKIVDLGIQIIDLDTQINNLGTQIQDVGTQI